MADQDPDLYEEFIVEEEAEASSNRPFAFALAGLLGILLLSLLALGAYQLFFSGNGDNGQAVAGGDDGIAATATVISATNEAIETQNAFVTQTLVAMELTAQAPTFTPTPPPTLTPTPIPTATATATAVVEPPTADAGDGVDDDATPVFDDDGDGNGEDGGDGSDETVGSADVNANSGNSAETLPETGITIWGGIAAALGLIFLMFAARRLRA